MLVLSPEDLVALEQSPEQDTSSWEYQLANSITKDLKSAYYSSRFKGDIIIEVYEDAVMLFANGSTVVLKDYDMDQAAGSCLPDASGASNLIQALKANMASGAEPVLEEEPVLYRTVAEALALSLDNNAKVLLTYTDGKCLTTVRNSAINSLGFEVAEGLVMNVVHLILVKGYKAVAIDTVDKEYPTVTKKVLTISDQFSGIELVEVFLVGSEVSYYNHLWYSGDLVPISFFDFKGKDTNTNKLLKGLTLTNIPEARLLP